MNWYNLKRGVKMAVNGINNITQYQINTAVKQEIMERIKQAEIEHGVKVLYAIESGSRAWGFSSPNSDYDVRFVYAHPKDWYLSVNLEDKRDVIEYPITDEIDINGWDIRKALKLFYKSNPTIIEWLYSPIIYIDNNHFAQQLRQLVNPVYSPSKGIYHYRNMANSNYRAVNKDERVPLKKYFYILRALLSVQWIEKFQSPAPVEFEKLRTLLADDHGNNCEGNNQSNNNEVDKNELNTTISHLLNRKQISEEVALIPTIPIMNQFIETELNRLKIYQGKQVDKTIRFDELNTLFLAVLNKN
ncbi:nucleotidyltransferase domain-containing protein [Algibacillus agarilyticus]|uniref:nucleotidyltransferase domain-containing protein n=1 Tax=Algibacillus agarilyticus TaxID=2234133 RepID=UPI001E58C14A|nr:nucleotidyltransferase domain-containing protein [Algibacillus agarilyticus]